MPRIDASATAHDLEPDVIRAWAICLVVLLHVAAPWVVKFPQLAGTEWWVCNVVDAFARPAVPLFVMISGLLLLDARHHQPPLQFLARRARRVLIPFVVWAGVYFLWRYAYHGQPLTPRMVATELLTGPVYVHLWYVYMLLGVYLLAPLLQVLVASARRQLLCYTLLLWFIFASLLPLIRHFCDLQVGVYLPLSIQFSGYFLLGYVVREVRLTRRQRYAAVLLIALLMAFTAGSTRVLSDARGAFDDFFYGYLTPNVVFMAGLWFVLLLSLDYRRLLPSNASRRTIVTTLAKASFGIYLIHLMVLELFQGGMLGFTLHGMTWHPLLGIPIATAAIIMASALIVVALRRVPVLRVLAA